ncbi:hypothetical protein [Bradyrhizobium sp. LHD-71]|uniref:hypothetical protein n=1 Tax=Bradyrhizobium sp. LHD-71 TaxID=3072141 RepID=UPI00280DC41B|nr:hypothetical protein [Bradyrhizobium sp. LHD-71]MDQ8729412.1 hypothetical protein [Bradyrhizobium sp. LHD-71]
MRLQNRDGAHIEDRLRRRLPCAASGGTARTRRGLVPTIRGEAAMFDQAIDEILIRLGEIVLALSHPDVTRSDEEKAALVKSVNQFATCASSSSDERVIALARQLEAAVNAQLPARLQ